MTSFVEFPDLASRLLGGGVVACNDEFFAPADSLVEPAAPVFTPRTFGSKGQVYDGWETRRRREPGHDWAIVRLGVPGIVAGVVVDTSFFVGNYPPYASIDATSVEGYPSPAELVEATWHELLPRSPLRGDAANPFPVAGPARSGSAPVTHVRLNIYPDGGVARLRVHGQPVPDPRFLGLGTLVDLAATEHGGRVIDASNRFYGNPDNLLLPGFARSMGEGWETARRRDDGNDWVLVRLGLRGTVRVAELDTTHFKGNAPGWARLTAASTVEETAAGAEWVEIVARTRLQPDTRHRFLIGTRTAASHVRLDVYPDGGMARLRLLGEPS
ncbi:MAG TPA: allantoicase [Micromonosporaceae bacterium]|jgi:allantoicase